MARKLTTLKVASAAGAPSCVALIVKVRGLMPSPICGTARVEAEAARAVCDARLLDAAAGDAPRRARRPGGTGDVEGLALRIDVALTDPSSRSPPPMRLGRRARQARATAARDIPRFNPMAWRMTMRVNQQVRTSTHPTLDEAMDALETECRAVATSQPASGDQGRAPDLRPGAAGAGARRAARPGPLRGRRRRARRRLRRGVHRPLAQARRRAPATARRPTPRCARRCSSDSVEP